MKSVKAILGGAVLACLLLLGVLTVCLPQRTFSENENRTLTTVPACSVSALLDGSYQDALSDALSDQLPLRDTLTGAGTALKLASGRRDIGDTYIGKDHYFFEKVTDSDIDQTLYQKNLARIETLAEQNPDLAVTAMLVPSSGVILSECLPDGAEIYDAAGMERTAAEKLTQCTVIDPTAQLREAAQSEQVYYRTDHHWTARGAYAGYQALMGERGQYGACRTETVSDSFLGTLYSRTLDRSAVADSIELPEADDRVAVTVDGAASRLYVREKLQEKDQYQVFLGGNFGRVDITGTGTGTLLVLKDSFANSLAPYLTADYARIILIDLRYYPGSVRQLLQEEPVDEMLVLYEMNNFASDSNLAKLSL